MNKFWLFCLLLILPITLLAENRTLIGENPILIHDKPSAVSASIGSIMPHTRVILLATDQTTGYALVEQGALKGWVPTDTLSAQTLPPQKNVENTTEKHWHKTSDSPTIRPDSLFLSSSFWALVAVSSLLLAGAVLYLLRKRL